MIQQIKANTCIWRMILVFYEIRNHKTFETDKI